MTELGAPDPGVWAGSEIREGIPQQARYLALRRIWAKALMPWRDRVGGLHESLLEVDPNGIEAADFC